MKIVGLITEYNPFHNGHKYHIEKAKEITGADYCIAVMSGNFVQRGAPAFLPKHMRAQMALENGCDLILELPVCYATGSAEYFAMGAISLLDKLGCVDAVCFGSECGEYDLLYKIAQIITNEPMQYKESLQSYLKQGVAFPAARQLAIREYTKDSSLCTVLESPNNILGIEYIKALLLRNSKMKGYTIQRQDSSYHDTELSGEYSSASAIRALFENSVSINFSALSGQLPESCLKLLKSAYCKRYPVGSDDLSLLLRYRLLSETRESLVKYVDMTPDLANRILNTRNDFLTYEQFCDTLKTRELTYSRISRSLLHILLNIKKDDIAEYYQRDICMYARVLGFIKDSSVIFSKIKKYSQIPLITNLPCNSLLDNTGRKMLETDIYAADLYENIVSSKFKQVFINEYTQQIIKK